MKLPFEPGREMQRARFPRKEAEQLYRDLIFGPLPNQPGYDTKLVIVRPEGQYRVVLVPDGWDT